MELQALAGPYPFLFKQETPLVAPGQPVAVRSPAPGKRDRPSEKGL